MSNSPVAIGDEVLYHHGAADRWTPATVLDIAAHDGDLKLDTGDGPDLAALDVKHGTGPHHWLRYEEAAALPPGERDEES